MEITNPFTGEILDTGEDPKTWAPKAIQWLEQAKSVRQMQANLRSELGALIPGDKRTDRWVTSEGWGFVRKAAERRYESSLLQQVAHLQRDLPDELQPIRMKVTYEVAQRAFKQLEDAELDPGLRKLVDGVKAAKKPEGAPSIEAIGDVI